MSLGLVPFLLYMWSAQQGLQGQIHSRRPWVFSPLRVWRPRRAFIVNQFGYVGSGFRRYFLFPVDPGEALRASSLTLLSLCSVYIALAGRVLGGASAHGLRRARPGHAPGGRRVRPVHVSRPRLVGSAYTGARRCDPNKTMGNDLSLLGNLVVGGRP